MAHSEFKQPQALRIISPPIQARFLFSSLDDSGRANTCCYKVECPSSECGSYNCAVVTNNQGFTIESFLHIPSLSL